MNGLSFEKGLIETLKSEAEKIMDLIDQAAVDGDEVKVALYREKIKVTQSRIIELVYR